MYLLINNTQYPVTKRIVSKDTVKFLSVSPDPRPVSGLIQMYRGDGFLLAEDDSTSYTHQTYAGTILTLTNKPEPEPVPSPTPEPQATTAQTLAAVNFARMMLPVQTMTADQTITVAALYDEWSEGAYQVGDIRLAWYEGTHQPWKCRQAHDTDTYPDITPEGTAWRTFWIPFHGTTPETAQNWIAPSGAHDQYNAGEYMVYNGQTYRALMATVYTPDEYAQAWEAV